MTDHAPYLHAVARHLDKAGFHVLSVGGHDCDPRGGRITLGCQDGWDRHDGWDHDGGDAELMWDVNRGWGIRWGGLTDSLGLPHVAPPAVVAIAVGHHVGQTPLPVDGETFDRAHLEHLGFTAGTPGSANEETFYSFRFGSA